MSVVFYLSFFFLFVLFGFLFVLLWCAGLLTAFGGLCCGVCFSGGCCVFGGVGGAIVEWFWVGVVGKGWRRAGWCYRGNKLLLVLVNCRILCGCRVRVGADM